VSQQHPRRAARIGAHSTVITSMSAGAHSRVIPSMSAGAKSEVI
jgi:hypothetical protein